MLHQAPDQAQRQDGGALADQQPEMRAVRAGHAQGEQPAQGRMGDDVGAIVEQARIEPRLPDDRIGIEAEIAQGRHDLLGDAQVDVAGWKRSPRVSQDGDGTVIGCPALIPALLDAGPVSLVIAIAPRRGRN